MTKRISVRIRDANPLFRFWISEWANQADIDGRENLATSLRRALTSLEKYPLPMMRGRDCLILEGFGRNFCEMLDKKLAKHHAENLQDSAPRPPPAKVKPKPVIPKAFIAQSENADPVPGPSQCIVPTKKVKRTKGAQDVLKIPILPDDNRDPAAVVAAVKPGVKRKATAPIDSLMNGDVIMLAGTFDILLLVDSMETVGKNKRHMDATLLELDKSKVRYEVRHLNVGDFTWIARDRRRGHELVLPYIVERKRLDDLAGSIKSGRYHEQKFRLRNSGIPNITYLIEYLDVKNYGLPIQTLYKAVVNSEVHSDCQIKFTDSARDTILYLSVQTTILGELFGKKTLCSCAKDQLPGDDAAGEMASLMQFGEFNQSASKWGAVTIRDFFVRQLVQLAQMTVEKAMAVAYLYPTPRALLDAYDDLGDDDTARAALLAKIPYGAAKRTIGPSLSKIIYDLYHRTSSSSPG